MALETYKGKRNFKSTPEPEAVVPKRSLCRFVVQEHHARRLHYDLRLEMGGVLKSWAVPKGPSLNPADKRLAVLTEDHPVKYLHFAGHIPKGNYGAGDMAIWDTGTYESVEGDPQQGFARGKLAIRLDGMRLKGLFKLVRLREENQWLLIKSNDEYADTDWVITQVIGESTQVEATPLAKKSSVTVKAQKAPMPKSIKPMLAATAKHPPPGTDWLYEIKWDGYRAIAFCEKAESQLISRNGLSLSQKFPEIAAALGDLKIKSAILDGEIVALDDKGKPSFQLLQNRAGLYSKSRGRKRNTQRSAEAIRAGDQLAATSPVLFYAFDLLYLDGLDLRELPLLERKSKLQKLLHDRGALNGNFIRYSDHVVGAGSGEQLLQHARKLGLEGVIAKQIQSTYKERRSEQWQKIKLVETMDTVVGGFTAPRRSRPYFGALVIGQYRDGELHYVGHTGSGFNLKTLKETYELLQPLVTARCPFVRKPSTNEAVTWVKPKLVCEVKYTELTQDVNLRHPIFLGLRFDKNPDECVLVLPAEKSTSSDASKAYISEEVLPDAKPATSGRGSSKVLPIEEAMAMSPLRGDLQVEVEGQTLNLTNLHKVYWPDEGYTKGDLLRYYFQISETILPYLRDRPLILQRFPNGIYKQSFHQHNVQDPPPFLQTFAHKESREVINYALCNNLASLLYLANLGTIAQHAWLSRYDNVTNPDWVVFDLDPADEVPFSAVCTLALELRDILKSVGLESYAKTSGSMGMHVYVPFEPRYSYDQLDLLLQLVAQFAENRLPELVTLERAVGKRPPHSIYLDIMQNREGKSVATPWSPRAKPGATVSTPLTWAEVKKLPDPKSFTILTVPQRLQKRSDPFANTLNRPQQLEAVLGHLDKLRPKEGSKVKARRR